MREPKAFAFAGDWHANVNWAVNAINAVAERGADAILHLGDYGYTFSDRYVDAVEKACADNDLILYFIDGNHDLHELLWALPLDEDGLGILSEHVRYIPRGYRWEWWGLRFMGLGGATSVDKEDRTPFVEWWPTEALSYGDIAKACSGSPVDVMITHDAPSDIPIPGISFREGLQYFSHNALQIAEAHRRQMREVFESVKPKLFVHGHYHRLYSHYQEGCRFVGLDCDGTSGDANLWLVRNTIDLVGV